MTPPPPRVGIGIPLHNRAQFLPEALDSLLAQRHTDFTIALVDDGSTDTTEAIAREYQRADARVHYLRFPERRGMVAAWRAAFEAATAGGARYFAWGSDHDRWHPDWLQRLVELLDADERVVLAYPLTQRIDADGGLLAKPFRQFETSGVRDRMTRWAMFSRSDAVAAGDMVYGLMRADAVRDAGVFRQVLCPDRLLIAELTLRGEIRQVPEVLWYRRQFSTGSVERQRQTLYPPGVRPPGALVPPWYLHARSLWRTYATDSPPLGLRRRAVAGMVSRYAVNYAWRHYAKSSVQHGILTVLGWPRWLYKRAKHLVLLAVYHLLLAVRHRRATR